MGIAATFLLSAAFAGKFSICLGSFSKYENATNYVNTLLINGFSVTIEPSLVKEKLYYRILLAETFDTMTAASKVRADFAEEFGRNDIWIMNTNLSKKNIPSIVARNAQKELENKKTEAVSFDTTKIDEAKTELSKLEVQISEKNAEIAEKNSELSRIETKIDVKNIELAELESAKAELNEIEAKIAEKSIELTEINDIDSKISEKEKKLENLKNEIMNINAEIGVANTKLEEKKSELAEIEEVAKVAEIESEEEIAFVPRTEIEPSTAAEISFKSKTEIPTTITENVQELIKLFPLNKNFKLEGISLFDIDNIRDGGLKIDTTSIDSIENPYKETTFTANESVHAVSLGKFEDNDFGAKLSVLMMKMENSDVASFLKNSDSPFDIDFEVEFELESLDAKEKFNCFMVKSKKDSGEYRLFGENQDKSLFLSIQAEDLGKDWINRFIVAQNSADEDVLKNEFLKKSLLTLPNEDLKLDRRFLNFDLAISGDTVERESGFENPEHWNASANFDQEDTILRIGFFDID